MRKFGGLGSGKSPMRQRPQPKTSMTSLASLAEMVGQSNEDDYSNIKLCLNSQKPQLELQESQQNYSKGWGNRNQSPLRRGLNKENDFNQYGNKNIFDNNRFADCLIKERPEGLLNKNPSHSPISGGVFPKNRQDVSPGKQRGTTSRLQEGDLVFKAGGNKGMNFSEISRKFNEQEKSSSDLLSYAPTLEESRPKSRSKAPRIQKQFDEDHFIDVKESIKQDQFSYKATMNAGQRQRFETKIEEIKEDKMRMLRNNQGNKTLLPKVIEEIKANATREIEEFAMYLFNQSNQEEENLLPPNKVEERKVIIGAKQPPSFLKPIESHLNRNTSSEAWTKHPQMPLVESEYPHETPEYRTESPKIPSPTGLRLQPQPTQLVRGLELGNSKDNTVLASIKQIGLQFSRKQDEIVQELQRKREEEERVGRQREEQRQREREREREKQQDLMKEMEAKRKRFQEDARLRQEEAQRLEQERIVREEKLRVQQEQRVRREETLRREEQERREQERLRVEREERERQELSRQLEQERVERERREYQEMQLNRMRVERERLEALEREAERQRQLQVERLRVEREEREAEERRVEEERLESERKARELRELEEAQRERERVETERIQRERAETQRIQSQRIERERIESQRLENERIQRQVIERQERVQRERAEERRREEQREREESERRDRQRRQAIEDEERRNRVLAEMEEERKREEALRETERLEREERERVERQRLSSAPVNTSFKFDLGDPLKTSFKFDTMFTNFSLGSPDVAPTETPFAPTETPFAPSVPTPSTLDQLTSNNIKQSINLDFQFDLGLGGDISSSTKFN